MIAYDARPLQPKTRHWGVGVVIDAILSRLNTQFEFCGLAHKFAGYKQEGIHAWPTIKKSNAIFLKLVHYCCVAMIYIGVQTILFLLPQPNLLF
jgi:hypothetical protein